MKRFLMTVMAVFSLSLPLFALGAKESAAEGSATPARSALQPIALRVGALKGPTGIGMVGLFESPPELPDGATVSFEAVASADAMAAKILSGELDAAVLPVNMAAKLYNAGRPYRLLAVVGNGMVKVVTTDPGIKSIADLRGRDAYVAGQGATPEFLLRTVLPKAGLDPSADLRLIFSMPYPEIAASVVAGRIDVAVLPEPFATLALKGNPKARVPFSLSALWTEATGQADYPMSVLVARSSLVADRPGAVAALMDAYAASIRGVVADPSAAGLLVEKHDMGLSAPIAAAAIPSCAFVFIPAAEARPAVEALLSVFLAASPASIGSRLPDGDWYATVKR